MQSIVRRAAACGLAAMASASTSATSFAQSPPPSTHDTIVVMGCVTQQPAGDGERGAQPAPLVITDTRSTPPRKFVLKGNAGQLAWHVGHTLEVHGRVQTVDSKDAAARSAPLTVLDVQSVIYLQPACGTPPK
jgi:hypothetical protein